MDGLLTAVKTTSVAKAPAKPLIQPVVSTETPSISSAQHALDILKGEPNIDNLDAALHFVDPRNGVQEGFSVATPGPLSAQILHTLVNSTISDYWRVLTDSGNYDERAEIITRCLRCVGGLGALVARLRALTTEARQKGPQHGGDATYQHIEDILSVFVRVLEPEDTSNSVWLQIQDLVDNSAKRLLLWREYVAIVGTGKVLSICAEAADVLKASKKENVEPWVSKGADYAAWLGKNIATMIKSAQSEGSEQSAAVAQLCGRAFSLGYKDHIVMEIHNSLSMTSNSDLSLLSRWVRKLQSHEQRHFLSSTLSFISTRLESLNPLGNDNDLSSSNFVSAAAALLHQLIKENDLLKDSLVSSLASPASGSAMSTPVIRSAISALAQDEDRIQQVVEKSLGLFGDKLYIRHTPMLHQETLAKTLLLASGYVKRSQPMFLFTIARSSTNTQGISNRLAASSPRARLLGMMVGMAISELVDKPDTRMKFELEADEAEEAEWYRKLTQTEDKLGSIEALAPPRSQNERLGARRPGKVQAKPKTQQPRQKSKDFVPNSGLIQEIGPRIVEIVDDESEDDDLKPYAKPDSDPEDEDEDPTLVKRNKPTAPVYIRDLIAGLKDHEDYDRHTLALSTAASLIRRKSKFGKEVTDHIDELATTLINLSDHFDLDNFQELRQQALVAVLLAEPAQVGPAFARAYFEGEYSIQQRLAVLTAIGLGARELAGFEDAKTMTPSAAEPQSSFPSKMLPPHLHNTFAESPSASPVDAIARRLERTLMEPMALDAADKMTGPNVLKVRTFSSRMEVEKKRKKPIANELAKVVAQSFFFPLTGRWWSHLQAYGSKSVHASPQLLPIYLKTLALLFHSSGPSTVSLPSLTAEFWDLLLNTRSLALNDITIMEALLFSILTLLEVNEDQQRLAQEHAKELLETQVWVREVFEKLGNGNEEDERVRMLAAGVLVRCQEVAEKFQRLLMGDMVGF